MGILSEVIFQQEKWNNYILEGKKLITNAFKMEKEREREKENEI